MWSSWTLDPSHELDSAMDMAAWAGCDGRLCRARRKKKGKKSKGGRGASKPLSLPLPLLLVGSHAGAEEAQRGARMTVSIAQFGSTRSINAGVAAGIAMHAWIRQHADLSQAW